MPTPSQPRARGPKAVKVHPQALLDAAVEVFARDGLQGSSLRAIARQANCDPALIYYHFRNKEELFLALVESRIPGIVADLRRLAGSEDTRTVPEKLWAVMGIFHTHLEDSPGMRSLVRGEMVRGAPGIRELLSTRMGAAAGQIRAILDQGVALGLIRPGLQTFFLAFFLVRMEFEILDLMPLVAGPMGGLPAEGAVANAEHTWFEVFWRGIATRPEDPLPFLPEPPCAS